MLVYVSAVFQMMLWNNDDVKMQRKGTALPRKRHEISTEFSFQNVHFRLQNSSIFRTVVTCGYFSFRPTFSSHFYIFFVAVLFHDLWRIKIFTVWSLIGNGFFAVGKRESVSKPSGVSGRIGRTRQGPVTEGYWGWMMDGDGRARSITIIIIITSISSSSSNNISPLYYMMKSRSRQRPRRRIIDTRLTRTIVSNTTLCGRCDAYD